MPNFPSLEIEDGLPHLFARFNSGTEKVVLELLHQVMREQDSQLSVAQREVIAFFVSKINGCTYCAEAHAQAALHFGAKPSDIIQVRKNPSDPALEQDFRSLLRFLRKVISKTEEVSKEDTAFLLLVGYNENTIYHATLIASVVTMMNKMVNAVGLETDQDKAQLEGRMLKMGYRIMIKQFSLR